jgi:hypothetical protein
MRIFLLSAIFSSLFGFLEPIHAQIDPSRARVNEQEISYQLSFDHKQPLHPEKMSVSGSSNNYRGQFLSLGEEDFINVTFETPKDFSKEKRGVEVRLSHLAAMLSGNYCHCTIKILVNDRLFLEKYDPSDGKISNDRFDITNWVQEGANTITILFLEGPSQYWLHDLHVSFFPI